jgi:hypothetical protein
MPKLMVSNKLLFIQELAVLVSAYGSEERIIHAYNEDGRTGRLGDLPPTTLEAVLYCDTQTPSLQTLHKILIGLENCGMSRKDLEVFARNHSIPYDIATGCVLPTTHEFIGKISSNKLCKGQLYPSRVLRALRTARDINLSSEYVASAIGDMHVVTYQAYENPQREDHRLHKPVLDADQTNNVLNLFDRVLREKNDGLSTQECIAVETVMQNGYPHGATLKDMKPDDTWPSVVTHGSTEKDPFRPVATTSNILRFTVNAGD